MNCSLTRTSHYASQCANWPKRASPRRTMTLQNRSQLTKRSQDEPKTSSRFWCEVDWFVLGYGCHHPNSPYHCIGRDAFHDAMTKENIGVGVHYLSITEHRYYKRTFNWRPQDYTSATAIGRQTVSLLISAKRTDGDAENVIQAVSSLRGAR